MATSAESGQTRNPTTAELEAIKATFQPGQEVLVDHGKHCGSAPGKNVYVGTVVSFRRGEEFTIREPECGTT